MFRNSSSTLYVVKNCSGVLIKKDLHKLFGVSAASGVDSIRVGDLILSVNEQDPVSLAGIDSIVKRAPGDSVFICVDRSTENTSIVFKVAKSSISSGIARTIPPTAYVFDVIENGASDRAGMKIGDLIVHINGKGFKNVAEADSIMHQGQIGKSIEYQVLRANRTVRLDVTLAAFGIPISCFIVFLSGLLYMMTGLFLSLKRPQLKAARFTGLTFLTLGFFIAVSLLLRDSSNDLFVRVRGITFVCSLYFGLALLFHSRHYFPKERPELLSRRWIRITMYGLAAIAIIHAFVNQASSLPFGMALMFLFAAGVSIYFWKQCPPEYKKLSRIVNWISAVALVITVGIGSLININISNNQDYTYLFGYMGGVPCRDSSGTSLLDRKVPLIATWICGCGGIFNIRLFPGCGYSCWRRFLSKSL